MKIIKIPEIKKYKISEVIDYANKKACTSLRIFEKKYGEENFNSSLIEYGKKLRHKFSNVIFERHDHTLIICQK
jgi:hypothetical protein